jgi:hypothetical protein
MDNHQQQRMNEVDRQFTNALTTANKANADRTVEAQQLGAQLTEYFFDTVINNLRIQAEGTRQVMQQLTNQQQRTQEATRQLTRASTDTYKDFLGSMFFFSRGVSRGPRYVSKKPRDESRMPRGVSRRLKDFSVDPALL